MDFGFTEEQEKLRKEVRDFFLNELPKDFDTTYGGMVEGLTEEIQSFGMQLQRKAGEKGYLTPGWPREYGGLGMSSIEQGIVAEETAYAGVFWPSSQGIHLAGPATILFGTEEQKREFLPALARGKTIWMQAFTEPNAGSDSANQQTRARRDGDYFVVNGQKTFISGTYKPNYLYALARTADATPKHRGISLFLIPGDLPGITYRPLRTMGDDKLNEIFFDDVRVHEKYLLGELNRGFYHAMATFEFERSGTDWPAQYKPALLDFIQFCKEEKRGGKPIIENPEVRKAVAQMVVDMEVWRLIAWESVWWFGERDKLGSKRYDLTGFFWKIFPAQHVEAMMRTLSLYGQLKKGSKWAKLAGRTERAWQGTRSMHGGGTIEIVKNVIADRGLGLPRARRLA